MKKFLSLFLAIITLFSVFACLPLSASAASSNSSKITFRLNPEGESYFVYDVSYYISGDVVIPETYNDLPVTRIGATAFYDAAITSIEIPETVTVIEDGAFKDCDSLEIVSLPGGITEIADSAFYDCDSLTVVNINSAITKIGASAFYSCGNIGIFNIPETVTEIGDSAFESCVNLYSVKIPNSVKTIGKQAFYNCDNLATVTFGTGLELIGEKAFYGCEGLQRVTFPANVETIRSYAFAACSSLMEYTVLGKDTFLYSASLGFDSSSSYSDPYDDIKIKGLSGSNAESYARNNDITFVNLAPATVQLKSVKNNKDSVSVTWNAATGSDKSLVYRKAGSESSWTLIATVTSTSYTDYSVSSGKQYTYTVKGMNSYGAGGYNAAGYKTVFLTPVNAVSAKSVSSGGIKVLWNKVPGASEYIVYRTYNGSKKAVATVGKTEYVDKDAAYGKKYTYTIVASAGTYYSVEGNSVSGKNDVVKPTSITEIKMNSDSKVVVKWEKVDGAKNYIIYRSTKSNKGFKKVASVSSTSYTDKKVKLGKTYYYRVVVNAGDNKSKNSNVESIKVTIAGTSFKTTANVTSSSVSFSWKKASCDGYYLYKKTDGKWKKLATIKDSSTTSYTDQSKGGYYKISAYKTINGKLYTSEGTEGYFKALSKPKINVDQYQDDFAEIIKWKKVSGATNYDVYYKIEKKGKWKKAGSTDELSYVSQVKHGKYYYWKVRATCIKNGFTSVGEFSKEDVLMIHYTPSRVRTYISDKSNSKANVAVILVDNAGSGKMRVYSDGARFIDNDYDSYDRDLYLVDPDEIENDRLVKVNYIDIEPGESGYLTFIIDGEPSWYDRKTRIRFNFTYDNSDYYGYCSNYYGFNYYDN